MKGLLRVTEGRNVQKVKHAGAVNMLSLTIERAEEDNLPMEDVLSWGVSKEAVDLDVYKIWSQLNLNLLVFGHITIELVGSF